MNFAELLGNLKPEDVDLELDSPCYEFSEYELIIDRPLNVVSKIRSKILCRNIQIRSSNVTLDSLEICGGILIRDSTNVNILNCHIWKGDMSSGGGIVLTRANRVTIKNMKMNSVARVPGIFAESGSTLVLTESTIEETYGFICAAIQCEMVIDKCTFTNSSQKGIALSAFSALKITDSKIVNTEGNAIAASHSVTHIEKCDIIDCHQIGVLLGNCVGSSISQCTFDKIKSSCISVTSMSEACVITKNKIKNADGNGVYVSDHSSVFITENEISDIGYPAVAVLQHSKAFIQQNVCTRLEKTGMCIRGAEQATLVDNTLSNIGECGFSISETKQCIITGNKVNGCNAGGCETYNMSHATLNNNVFENVGKFGFACFTGGEMHADGNTVSNVTEAMVWLTAGGCGEFTNNVTNECPQQYAGSTSGWFVMQGNGKFENMTNDETKAAEGVPFVPDRRETPKKATCFRCKTKTVEGFCVTCGHKVYCNDCGKAVAAESGSTCPLCRFPITSFTEGFTFDEECEICLERKPDCIVLPCGHIQYCEECLEHWLDENRSCPTCRAPDVTYKKLLPEF